MIDIAAQLSAWGNLGYIPPSQRTPEQHEAHDDAMAKMPAFFMAGTYTDLPMGEKVLMTDSWDNSLTISVLGKPFIGWHQYSGSCVGQGGGTALCSLTFGDAIFRGEAERIILPYWPANYARSRLAMGERGPGEGSMGSTFAQSCKEDGVLDFAEGQAPYHVSDAFTLGTNDHEAADVEIKYSDGTKVDSDLLGRSRKHPCRTVTRVRSFDEVWQGTVSKFPSTFACTYMCAPGRAKVQGDALVGRLADYGPHQMSVHGAWNHPKLGRLLRWQNTWGPKVYDPDPTPQEKPGGFWLTEAEVTRCLKMSDTEAFIMSQYEGYPAAWNPSPW